MSDESEFATFHDAHRREISEPGYDAHAAFRAIELAFDETSTLDVVGSVVHGELKELEKLPNVVVPYHAIQTLAVGWKEFKRHEGRKRLGEVFELEGGHRGARRGYGRLTRRSMLTHAAMQVDELMTSGLTRRRALVQVHGEIKPNMSFRNFEKQLSRIRSAESYSLVDALRLKTEARFEQRTRGGKKRVTSFARERLT